MPKRLKAGWTPGKRRAIPWCLRKLKGSLGWGLALGVLLTLAPQSWAAPAIDLPEGFSISVFTDQVPYARALAPGPSGAWFVGTRKDRVYLVWDRDGDGRAETVRVLLTGLHRPNGVAFRHGDLFVGEIHRILRYPKIMDRLDAPPPPEVVARYPDKTWHGLKVIRFGPDGLLYVPVGAPCNVCETLGTPFGAITTLNVDTKEVRPFAHGVRNSVGLDWHPLTGELWFTDNGRDLLGDNLPPDELNHAPEAGLHFGFPYRHGRDVPDPEFGELPEGLLPTPPAQPLGPHVASLGMRFYTGNRFPPSYRNQIFICEHGSWNRSEKIGYRITLVRLSGNTPISYEPFASGWHKGNQVFGRPVDLAVMDDGSLLVSDDHAGVLYRIVWKGI
ncbi:PQQ-dependent sugar dehydrogenase [Desulfoluna spongiiphila]|uniref:Glucose/arabinose dehydrogenase, beta-propeller fold n=1 Tax=Desulfoluna spongiiphila TaxID=419481 RepID=A0A1G5JMJ6_9BACT|nr:PQQ-dependent sugar dehydrogenase [Desulfoluna spongiiphila]SCY89632.1 Glucose/arabinose dehydrogenase, beta-propeller fold [Desulfoluna spongiiphila]